MNKPLKIIFIILTCILINSIYNSSISNVAACDNLVNIKSSNLASNITTSMANSVSSNNQSYVEFNNLVNSVFSNTETFNSNELFAKHAAILDADSNRLLLGKDENTPVPMASTTKIMTCIIALTYAPLDLKCVTSEYAASMPDVQLNASVNEEFTLSDLLYSLMLKSHNDTAVIIAENVAKYYLSNTNLSDNSSDSSSDVCTDSKELVKVFTNLMNEKAKELGCNYTHFVTPNGLDASDEYGIHSTTAKELAIIMSYCIKNEDFLKITQAASHSFNSTKNGKLCTTYDVSNSNAFLNMYDSIISGKTGFTCDAGYCYVCAYKDENRTFVLTLLACGWPNNKTYKWKDARKLLDYARNSYFPEKIIKKDTILQAIELKNGYEINTIHPIIDTNTDYVALLSKNDVINVKFEYNEISLPIKRNDVIGSVYIFINNELTNKIAIISDTNIYKKNYPYFLYYLVKCFFLNISI